MPFSAPGIPGTFIDPAAARIRWVRNQVMERELHSRSAAARMSQHRVYLADVADGLLRAFTSQDPKAFGGAWRMSMVHSDHQFEYVRLPTWDEFKSGRYQLIPRNVHMAILLPGSASELPDDSYIDTMPFCLQAIEVSPELCK